jgi:hypothetical protein
MTTNTRANLMIELTKELKCRRRFLDTLQRYCDSDDREEEGELDSSEYYTAIDLAKTSGFYWKKCSLEDLNRFFMDQSLDFNAHHIVGCMICVFLKGL